MVFMTAAVLLCVSTLLAAITAPVMMAMMVMGSTVQVHCWWMAGLLSYQVFDIGDLVSFADVDECLLQTHTCSDWAFCTNTVGGYNCSCLPGYSGDGANCTGMFSPIPQ